MCGTEMKGCSPIPPAQRHFHAAWGQLWPFTLPGTGSKLCPPLRHPTHTNLSHVAEGLARG